MEQNNLPIPVITHNMFDPIPLVAIIDDDEIHTFAVEMLMNNCHFAQQIVTFSNGKEALNFFSTDNHTIDSLPDVIILDIDMPVMDAWGFLDEFKKVKGKISKRIPIYILTTSIYRQDRRKASAYPEVSGFFVKPLKKENLAGIAIEMASNK